MAYNPLNPNGSATSANSQPVVIASDQGAVPITSATLATAARQDTGNTSIASVDTKTPALGQALAAASVPVVLTAAQVTTLTPPAAISGFATSAKQDTIIGHVDGIEGILTTIDADTGSLDAKTPALGQALAAASVPVVLTAAQISTLTPPAAISGFATAARQDTGNTSVGSIDTKTPALGQALAAASVPIVLTAAQVTTLTPPAAITGFATLAEQQTQTTALQLIDNAISGAGFNITQQGGVAVSLNTGVRDAGTQRVTIATNDLVPVSLAAETTKVIGTVNQGTSPWVVTGGGGGTEYTEDAVAAADPVGTSLILVRQDTPAGLVSANGDNVAQRATNFGAAYTQIITSAGAFVDTFGGGTQYADAAVRGTATGTLAMGDDGTNIQSLKVDANGELQIDVLTLPALVAGTANIGDVDVLTIAAGDNNIGNVDIVSGVITTVSTVTNLSQMGGVAISLNTGVRDTGTLRVTIATNDAVPVTDNSGSLTVDAPVGTPAFVRLSDGTAAIATLPVSLASVPSHPVTNAGTFAAQAAITAASGSIASGAVASGAIASGAIASGAIAAGAIAIGAFAAGATSIAENEDVAHATGDRGLKVWAVSNEANTARAADGDYLPIATDTEGNTRNVGNRDHDAVDAGEPVKVGGRAVNVEITAVANNDRTDAVFTLTGKQIVQLYCPPETIVRGVTAAMTATTTTSVIAAPAAGLRNYITSITVGNSHATVGTFVNLQDGSGGTTIWTIPAAAVFGGATISFSPPLRQPTTATALFCACVTTGSNTIVAANGYTGV